MKLMIVVVQDQDAGRLLEVLVEKEYSATKLASTGGFLKEGNTTLLLGVESDQVDEILDVVRDTCKSRKQHVTPLMAMGKSINTHIPHPVEVPVGGGIAFVLDVERFERI